MIGELDLPAAALLLSAPVAGSFVGLLADRIPRGEGVVLGGSRCDHCGARLGAVNLVPLLSFAAQRGRSGCCGARLRPFLPLVELGALGIAAWALTETSGALAWITAGLGWSLLALALIDLRCFRLPDALTLPLMLAGLAVAAAGLTGPLWDHALGAALGWLGFIAVAAAYRAVRGGEGLGLGDAKLMAAAGAWIGWQGLASVVLLGCVGGIALALATGAAARGAARTPVPFGPSLALGSWLTWLYGPVTLG